MGIFLSLTSDHYVQCSRVGLEVKIYDTPAGGIRASQGTFSSYFKSSQIHTYFWLEKCEKHKPMTFSKQKISVYLLL